MMTAVPAIAFPFGKCPAWNDSTALSEHGIALRPARECDLPFLQALYASTRVDEFASLAWPEDLLQTFLAQQFGFQHQHFLQHYQGADFWVIEHQGKAVGRYYLLRQTTGFLIVDISLLPQSRGMGIGTGLLQQTLHDAKKNNCDLQLHVLQTNSAAQRLYSRMGFVIETADGSHYHMRRHAQTI